MARLTLAALHSDIGITPAMPGFGQVFGPRSRAALSAKLSNPQAAPITIADLSAAARRLGVPVGHIRGVRKIEAPRGPYDPLGRPSILYERHKFRNRSTPPGRWNNTRPDLSGPPYGRGGFCFVTHSLFRQVEGLARGRHSDNSRTITLAQHRIISKQGSWMRATL